MTQPTKWLCRKLPAGALLSTLIISLIISGICSLLLLARYLAMHQIVQADIDQRLRDDLSSAVLLAMHRHLAENGSVVADTLLFHGEPDSVRIVNEVWGGFTASHVSVRYKGRGKSAAFLYGGTGSGFNDACLYVSDRGSALGITGETYLQGTVYLPAKGMREGFFHGGAYSGKKMIDGRMADSRARLPALLPGCREYIRSATALLAQHPHAAAANDTATQYFDRAARQLLLPPTGKLRQCTFKGKIVLISTMPLDVDNSACLADVILVAPVIRFMQGFSGAVQAIATDSLIVDSTCRLNYPSALMAYGKKDTLATVGPRITVRGGAFVNGVILGLEDSSASAARPQVWVQKGAQVRGLIYNEGQTRLNGRVSGAVFTDGITDLKNGVTVPNVLEDAHIVSDGWFTSGAYSFVFAESVRPTVIKWLTK